MEKKRDLLQDTFYSKIFKLVLPIIIQNLLSAAVSSADVVMLNYVGQSSISAVSLASQYVSILFMVFYGLGTGATILCAQYYGKGDLQAIQVIEGIALRFSLACVVCGLCGAGAGTNDADFYQRYGTDYYRHFVSAVYERQFLMLGGHGSLSVGAAQHRKGSRKYGDECTGVFS